MEQYIYLVDDDQAILSSLSALLSTVGWKTKAYDSAQSLQQSVSRLHALTGCMLLDIRMPGKTGLTLLDEWRQQGLEIPVIIMTGHANINSCRRAFKNGAIEFLTKPIDADLLFEVIGGAMDQQASLQAHRSKILQLQSKLATLTTREKDIFEQIMMGNSSKGIACTLSLSSRTVETHRANIFGKLDVNSLPKLINMYGEIVLNKNH